METIFQMKVRHQREWNEKIVEALEATGGDRTKAAEMLGIHRSAFSRRIRRYDLLAPPPKYGRPTPGSRLEKLPELRRRHRREVGELVTAALRATGGCRAAAARLIDMERAFLQRVMRERREGLEEDVL